MKKTRLNLAAKLALTSLCLSAGLVISGTGMTGEKTEDILAKVATPIKDIANLRELEGTTFHVINITEHDSVLPAELRLAGKESDWGEGVCGYVDGKEVPTGLLPGDKGMRLWVLVPLKTKEVKKVTFKKGKGTSSTDLNVKQEGAKVIISNRQGNWTLGPNGLEQFQRKGKMFGVRETGISNGTVKVTLTPAVCRVTLQAEGAGMREYLFFPNSPLWQVDADRNYRLIAGGTNAFYYSHPCHAFSGDPGSSYGAVIQTDQLEKGGAYIKGLQEFHLFSATDWGLLMDNGIGLGVYPNPSAHTILVNTMQRSEGVFVQAIPIDERSNAVFKKWHLWMGVERACGCAWWRMKAKPLSDTVNYVFGAMVDVRDGTVQRSGSLTPLLLRSLGDRWYGAQIPWITVGRTETICVEDLDGKGPDMLNDRWIWCDNGKPAFCFEFNDPNKDGRLDDVYLYAKWDDKSNALDSSELKYPVCALHDQTRDGKIAANCVFFGGRIDQDWFEYNSGIALSPPDRAMIERKKLWRSVAGWENVKLSPLEVRKFDRVSRALDLDGDGDIDIATCNRQVDDLDTDYTSLEGRFSCGQDRYDNNPFSGVLLDPFAGRLSLGGRGCNLGTGGSFTFRYKGLPVAGLDAAGGNMCLDGDGLPEAKIHFNAELFDDYFVFQPMSLMISSTLFLENRHALNKINHWLWQEGNGCNSCYKTDVGFFTIRKNSAWPWEDRTLQNTRRMPKRQVEDSITTYRDKWGNEIRLVGVIQPAKWDGKFIAGSKDPATVKDWNDSFHYDWDYLLATFEGLAGLCGESGYVTHGTRWEFCADYAQRRQVKLFYSELDGRLHLTGASWGHYTPYQSANPKKAPLDEFNHYLTYWLHEGYFCLDCDTQRYYAGPHETFFDEDRDGYLDSFLVDVNHDGWYEARAWYDRASRTVWCMKDGILALWQRNMEPYPEEEVLLDTDHYSKLVALKRMSMEKTSILKGTTIKAQPLSISVPGTNLWVGLSGNFLPQVLLDTAHCEAGIWRDLSPKGYSRLLTGLQRQKVVVRELQVKWSEESLRGASVLFVAPPYTTTPEADELKSVDAFLKGGGRMVVICPDWSVAPEGEVYALKSDKPLVPDGQAGEWASSLGTDLALKWEEPESYRVKIQVSPRWDRTHFYLYAEIYDRDLINKETGPLIWKDDSIQFALADLGLTWRDFAPGMGIAEGLTGICAKGGMRQEYGIARTDKGAEVYRWIDVPGNRTGPVTGAKLQVTREKNRTIYQLALPWTEVGKTNVQAGAILGIALWVWDREKNGEVRLMTMGNLKRPDQFRKLIFVDTVDTTKAYAGASVASPLDAVCASYGINRNPERTALAPIIDPHFRNRGLGPEVWERFKGYQSDSMMRDVRKLYFNGSSLSVSGSAVPLMQYQDKIIGARVRIGKGELLVFCSEMLLNNKYACFHSFEGGDCTFNEMPVDKLIDAKPDNNVFMDNLARYVVADKKIFNVLKASDAQTTVELAGPGKVYVNKGTKVAPSGNEAISGKENGNTVCFEIPASKDPIKLKISR